MKTCHHHNYITGLLVILIAVSAACQPPQNPVTVNTDFDVCVSNPDCHQKMVLAHRGTGNFNYWATENTLAAFDIAWKMGADSIETDVRKTSDGALIIMHDATVDKTTNGTGNVADMTLAQIKALKIRSLNPSVPVQSVPTFRETLDFLKGKTLLDVDVKNSDVHEMITEIAEAGMLNAAYLGINSLAEGYMARAENSAIALMPRITTIAEAQDYLDNLSPIVFFEIETDTLAPDLADFIHAHGVKIHMNALLNYDFLGKKGYKMLLDSGVDIIQTDRVDLLVPYLRGL